MSRLKRRADFQEIARSGRKWAAPGLVLQARVREATGLRGIRMGFTASRRVGTAVARNRCRRRLRAAAQRVIPAQAKEGYDFVLIARQQTATRPFDALIRDLETALGKLGARREERTRP